MAVAKRPADVFLNIPFADSHEFLYVALIAGLVAFRLNPRCVLEIPPQQSRLQRLYQLIASCPYSIHDLSHVRLSRTGHRVPRFNMPFELGIAVAVALAEQGAKAHQFRIFEARQYRLHQSLSDVLGWDPYIHRACADGVLEALLDAFPDLPEAPDLTDLRRLCKDLRRFRRERLNNNIYTPRAFSTLVVAARKLVEA